MTLSEEEKREMRGTDPRTAALLDEVESISPDLWDRLHGTVRYLDNMTGAGNARPAARAHARPRRGGALVGPRSGRVGRPRDATPS